MADQTDIPQINAIRLISNPPQPVRPLGGLRDRSDWVDCMFCRAAVQTIVETIPSDQAKVYRKYFLIGAWVAAVGGCCCFFKYIKDMPKKEQWYYDWEHKCCHCGTFIRRVPHDAQQHESEFVESKYGTRITEKQGDYAKERAKEAGKKAPKN